jgi:hypothetical protein
VLEQIDKKSGHHRMHPDSTTGITPSIAVDGLYGPSWSFGLLTFHTRHPAWVLSCLLIFTMLKSAQVRSSQFHKLQRNHYCCSTMSGYLFSASSRLLHYPCTISMNESAIVKSFPLYNLVCMILFVLDLRLIFAFCFCSTWLLSQLLLASLFSASWLLQLHGTLNWSKVATQRWNQITHTL